MTEFDEVARHHASAVRTAYADVVPPPVETVRARPQARGAAPGLALTVLGGVLVTVLVLAVAVMLLSRPDPVAPAAPGPISSTAAPSPDPSTAAVEPDVTAADVELADAFVAFATDPGPATAARLPRSPAGVRLGLGQELLKELPIGDVAVADNWWLADDEMFRGYVGPFSALTTLDQHAAADSEHEPSGTSGHIEVSVGPHPHCASPPMPPPPSLETQRRVSLQPDERSIDSCMRWFSVDLFLDEQGHITAVTLDLWEP